MYIEQIIDAVRALANKYPANVYKGYTHGPSGLSSCSYVTGTHKEKELEGCGCIFGIVLNQLGVSKETLAQLDYGTALVSAGNSIEISSGYNIKMILCTKGEIIGLEGEPEPRKIEWCRIFQSHQDCQRPWGYCLGYADGKVAL